MFAYIYMYVYSHACACKIMCIHECLWLCKKKKGGGGDISQNLTLSKIRRNGSLYTTYERQSIQNRAVSAIFDIAVIVISQHSDIVLHFDRKKTF